MNRRRKRRLPFAAYAALAFNAAICLTPFVAARAVSTAYGDKRPAYEPTAEAINATRQAMDERFAKLAANGEGAPREVWSNLVRENLEKGEMTAVNGLMLAAPAMIGGKDGAALKARIDVSDKTGDQAVIGAALAYLPEDVQDDYERRTQSVLAMFSNVAPAASLPGKAAAAPGKTAAKAPVQTAAAPVTETADLASEADADDHVQLNVLGDLRDLSLQASRWAHKDRIDEFAFILTGVGLILADGDPEAREGASIALSARRSQKLDPEFELYLEHRLYAAASPEKLKRLLTGEFQSEYGYSTQGPGIVQRIFQTSVDRAQLEPLLSDLRVLRNIARDTSASSAIAVLGQVKDGADLRRAQLVAQAGGDRMVPLAIYDGEHLLDTARTQVAWTNALKMQVAGVMICLGLLGFIALSVLVKSFTRERPKKVSAVYLMDEYPTTT